MPGAPEIRRRRQDLIESAQRGPTAATKASSLLVALPIETAGREL